MAEYNENFNLNKEYSYTPNATFMTNPLFMRTVDADAVDNNRVDFYFNDHLGTPLKLFSQPGTITWSSNASAFGEAHINQENVMNNLRYPGQYFDQETETHYNYYRDYNAELGRYLQSDPIGLGGGVNRYSYVYANVVNTKDEYGLAYPIAEQVGNMSGDEFLRGAWGSIRATYRGMEQYATSEGLFGEGAKQEQALVTGVYMQIEDEFLTNANFRNSVFDIYQDYLDDNKEYVFGRGAGSFLIAMAGPTKGNVVLKFMQEVSWDLMVGYFNLSSDIKHALREEGIDLLNGANSLNQDQMLRVMNEIVNNGCH